MVRASLIMVTWNAVEWSRRAIAAIAAHTDVPYELIIVDNGSTDDTRQFLRDEVSGATVVLNDRNLGFGVASNLGAARASAPILVFVNSDLIVKPGWLEPLCRRIEEHPTVAVAGPAILDLDGRIGEAGMLLAHDGWAMPYGAGADPEQPEVAYARAVDYVSGACLAVRANLFHETGGFDPAFETAYFEDADLCLRLNELGWRVMYEPASRVAHAGGASGTAENSRRLVAINHPRFFQRWRHVLFSRPDAPLTERPERILASRDAVASGTVLLIGDGAARDLAQSVAALAPDACVDYVEAIDETWLRGRRFHYDLVAGGSGDLLREMQPGALHVTLEDLRESMRAILIDAGITTTARPALYNAPASF